MADLGTIDYTNVNAGTRVVDRSAEVRAIGQGLSVAKTIIDETIIGNETEKMENAIDKQAAEYANDIAQDTTSSVAPYDPNSPEGKLANRMDQLDAVMRQGKPSAVTKAQLEIKSILATAKVKYPWLYDRLQSRAGAVAAGSATLQELGLLEESVGAAAKTAQAEYDAIINHARTVLKIDPSIDPRSPKFRRLYAEKQALYDNATTQEFLTASALADAASNFNNPQTYQTLKQAFVGELNHMSREYTKIFEDFEWDKLHREVQKGDQGDLQYIENWKNSSAGNLRLRLTVMQAELKQVARSITPEQRQDPRGAEWVKIFEDAVSEVDMLISAVDKMSEDLPSAVDQIDTAIRIRAHVAYNRLSEPGKTSTAFFNSGVGKTMVELAGQAKNPEGINLANQISLIQQTHLGEIYDELFDPNNVGAARATVFNSTGALQIRPGASAAEIRTVIRDRMADPNNSFIIPTNTNQDQQIAALHNMEVFRREWQKAQSVLPNASPDYANNTLLGITYSLEYMNSDLDKPKNATEYVLKSLSDGSLEQAVDVALKSPDNGRRNAFASAATDWYASTRPDRRRAEMGQLFNNHLIEGQVAAGEVVTIDLAALDKGEFKYKINDKKLEDLAKYYQANSFSTLNTYEKGLQKARDKVDEIMGQITQEMQQQIAIERLLVKARSPDGVNFQQPPEDWASFFLGSGSATPGSAWANVFDGSFSQGTLNRSL